MTTILKDLRIQCYDRLPAGGLRRYRRSEQEIAGVIGTESFYPPRLRIPRHAHDLPSFYVVLEGSMSEFYSGKQRDLEACSVVFTPAGEVHSEALHYVGSRCFTVELTSHWAERLAASGVGLAHLVAVPGFELAPLSLRLYREFRNTDCVSALSVEALVLEALAVFARQTEGAEAPCSPAWLRKATELVRDRFCETLTLGEIATEVGVHPIRLVRAFRKRHRCSPAEYQRRLRVEHSARQIFASRGSLAEIALSAGFADQAHFSRVFKAYTGMTPASFRATYTPMQISSRFVTFVQD